MPNEEAISVNLRVYYQSSLDSWCNYTDVYVAAGQIYMISLDYNQTASIMFTHNDTSRVYNVFTFDTPEDYEPIDLTVNLQQYLDDLTTVGTICAAFGFVGVWLAVRVRKQ